MEIWNKIGFFLIDSYPNVAAVLVGALILTYYLPKRSYYWLRVAASFLLAGVWVYFGKSISPQNGLLNVPAAIGTFGGLYLLTMASVLVWCRASWHQALFAATVSYSLQNMCERMIEILLVCCDWFPRQIIILLFAVTLTWLHRFTKKYQKEQSVFDFSSVDNRTLLFIASGVMAVCVVMDTALKNEMRTASLSARVCVGVVMVLFSFLSCLVSICHLRETDAEKRSEEVSQLLRAEQRRYESDKQIHDAINIKCHDIRHQIAAIRAQSTDDAYRAELKKIGKLVDIYDTTPHSQNAALDVVLAGKMLTCNNRNIGITCMADGRRMEFMDDCDIYALFGNILDNAIEAASQVAEPEQRLITLTVENRENFLVVECENYFSGKLVFDDGLPLTTKSDTLNHGFGTRSIRALTEKYSGSVKLSTQGDIFDLSILIPIPA